jgi:hypothetical protein
VSDSIGPISSPTGSSPRTAAAGRETEEGIDLSITSLGAYLLRYAQEASWREDYRRVSNGDQTSLIAGLAMHKRTSPDFTGYWQRHSAVQG